MIKNLSVFTDGSTKDNKMVDKINELIDAVNRIGKHIFDDPNAKPQTEPPLPMSEPPLNARVHQALGHKVFYANGVWLTTPYDANIPAYSEDVTLAIGALEEYCGKRDLAHSICCAGNHKLYGYWVHFLPNGVGWNTSRAIVSVDSNTLPLAICLAIVKHHESK